MRQEQKSLERWGWIWWRSCESSLVGALQQKGLLTQVPTLPLQRGVSQGVDAWFDGQLFCPVTFKVVLSSPSLNRECQSKKQQNDEKWSCGRFAPNSKVPLRSSKVESPSKYLPDSEMKPTPPTGPFPSVLRQVKQRRRSEITSNLRLVSQPNYRQWPPDPVFGVSRSVCFRRRYAGRAAAETTLSSGGRCRGRGWRAGVTARTAVAAERWPLSPPMMDDSDLFSRRPTRDSQLRLLDSRKKRGQDAPLDTREQLLSLDTNQGWN